MKTHTQSSFPQDRALIAASLALLFGAATAFAQSGSAGATSAGSGQKNPPASTSGSTHNYESSSTSSSSHPATAAPDVASTQEINAQTAASTGAGAPTGRDSTTSSGKISWGDRRFVTKAADGGQDEVALAQLAAERASNAEVKSFAQKLVDDHSQVNSELASIAGQKNVKIDKDADHDRSYKRLAKKSGAEFDREFVEHMIDEHEKDIKMFEKAASDAKDADIRSFASKHVDHLRQHLQTAQGLRQSVVPTGRTDTSSGRSTSSDTTDSATTTSDSQTRTDKATSSGSATPAPDSSR